jgi:hypothetical protein
MPVFLALLGFFLYVSRHRFIDGDEGFYLLASRLVLSHKIPYRDFFYTQAPLLPYVYAQWMKVAGATWVSGRTLPALLTTLVGLLVYGQVCRLTGKVVAGLSAVILFASSTLVFAWYPIAKTYSLAGLFLFAAYAIISRLSPELSGPGNGAVPKGTRPNFSAHPALNYPNPHKNGAGWGPRSRWANLFCPYEAPSTPLTIFVTQRDTTNPPLTQILSPWWIACGGLMLGLSVDTRSYIAGIIPVFLWWILRQSGTPRRITNALWFLGGFAAGMVPSVVLFALSPARYLFDNLGYHAVRSGEGLIGDWRLKTNIARLVLLGPDDNGLQFGMVATVCVALTFLLRKRASASLLAFIIGFALSVISILPSPPYSQYFCLCMPFLIVAVVCLINDYFNWLQSAAVRRAATIICAVLFVGYLVLGAGGFRNYLYTGSNIIGIDDPDYAPDWTLRKVQEVSKAIDQLVLPGEGIASLWPGYVFESRAAPYSGYENNFGWGVSWRATRAEQTKFHVTSGENFKGSLASHVPRVVVLGNDVLRDDPSGGEYASILKSDGYVRVRLIGDTSIYVCCARP